MASTYRIRGYMGDVTVMRIQSRCFRIEFGNPRMSDERALEIGEEIFQDKLKEASVEESVEITLYKLAHPVNIWLKDWPTKSKKRYLAEQTAQL